MSSRLEIEPEDRQEIHDEPAPRRQILRGTLLGLAVAALAGASWWAGHGSKPAAEDPSAVPEIHADAAPVKQAPANPGGLQVPDQDSILLNQEGKQQPEELLPPPETVKARPVAAKPSAPPPVQPTSASPSPSVAPPPAVPSTLAPQIASAPASASSSPAVISQAKAAPTAAATASGSYRLQLGALGSEEAAKQEWLKLQKQQPDVLGKLSLTVSRIELAKGTYYRIQAGPIADAAQAVQSCAVLKSRNVGCILVKP